MKKNTIFAIVVLAFLSVFTACSSNENAEMDSLAQAYCSCMQQVLDMKHQKPKDELDSVAMKKWKSETTDAMISASECNAQRVDTMMKAAEIRLQKKYGDANSDAYREAMGKSHEAFILGLKKHCPEMYNMFPTDDSSLPQSK